jgi:hypothetical protein
MTPQAVAAKRQYNRNYYRTHRAQFLARNLQTDIANGAPLPAGQYLACCAGGGRKLTRCR